MQHLAAQLTSVGVQVNGRENIQRVRAGDGDGVEQGSTALADFINHSTVPSASEYVYYYRDDGSVLPSPLPEPALTTISVQGQSGPGS
jgi:hypothetical protein